MYNSIHIQNHTCNFTPCRAMDNFLASSPEEVLFILLNFFKGSKKKIILHSSGGNHLDSIEKLCKFFESKFSFWIRFLDDAVNTRDQTNNQVSEKDAAILWGSICCYPNINSVHQDSLSLLKKLICNFDRLLEVGEGNLLEGFFNCLRYKHHSWSFLWSKFIRLTCRGH